MSITRKKVSDLVGFKVERLTVITYLGLGKHNKHYWQCQCECGGQIVLATYRLTGSKPTKSCGCLRQESMRSNRKDPTKHGLHEHKLYNVYQSMKQRCTNPNSQRWEYYGAKGVCVRWETFESFYEWSTVNGYSEGLSIDRIDSAGDYSPENCRWITLSENTRRKNIGNSRTALQESSCYP
jgi:hypothetical protein